MSAPIDLPRWADTVLVPAVSVAAAFLVAGLVVLGIGENPLTATRLLIQGSLGSGEGLGFTLFYMTDFIFVGLAVAVAYHAGLFNIGGEGQATLAGLGARSSCFNLSSCRASSCFRSACWAPRPSAPPGRRSPAISRPSAAAISSSRRSCSTGSPACSSSICS